MTKQNVHERQDIHIKMEASKSETQSKDTTILEDLMLNEHNLGFEEIADMNPNRASNRHAK